jgi:hypothetical protein
MKESEDRFIDEREVSRIIGRAVQTLRNDRHKGQGLSYSKVGRHVRYSLRSVLDFMAAHRIETGAL